MSPLPGPAAAPRPAGEDGWAFDERAALRVAAALTPPGPALPPAQAAEVAEGLRAAAAASVAPVAEVTGLEAPPETPDGMPVVDRATWVRLNVEMATDLLDAAGLAAPVATLRDRVSALANGAQLGAVLALLSSRVLGQYLPLARHPRLVLVAPNVAAVERAIGAPPDDFRLWVCLHEQTHRLQFARAPWLRDYLVRQFGDLVRDEGRRDATPARRLPASVLDLVVGPGQRVVLDRVTAVMSLLEGYADVMMDRVGPAVVRSVETIRPRFEARRSRGGWAGVLNRLTGLDLKLAQYREGAAFCRHVIGCAGVEGLNVVYEASGLLPSLEEIRDPDAWLARVHPGS